MATGSNQLRVADFAYVATWRGFVDVAFIVDALAGASSDGGSPPRLCTDFVLDALQQAIGERCGDTARLASCITATAARNTRRCAMPTGSATRASRPG